MVNDGPSVDIVMFPVFVNDIFLAGGGSLVCCDSLVLTLPLCIELVYSNKNAFLFNNN